MDWRRRNYYLVTISYLTYEMRMKYYRMAAPSLKIHAPYGHFKNGKELDRLNDGAKGHYWQMMLSCLKEDSDALEYELRKASRRDNNNGTFGSHFIKINKEICGQ